MSSTDQPPRRMGKYYAVAVGRATGVFESWSECQAQVHQYGGAKFKSFASNAEAQTFLHAAGASSVTAGSEQPTGDGAPAPVAKKPRGRPRTQPADKVAKAVTGRRKAALASLDSDPITSIGAEAGRGVDASAAACLDGSADGSPTATGVFANGGGRGPPERQRML